MSLHSAWLMLSLLSTTVNKEGRDLQTVFAAVGSRLHFSAERAGCEPTANGQLDCTEAVRRELGYEIIVFLKPVLIPASGATCSLIELRSVMRRAVLENPNFAGIGFFAGDAVSLIEKSRLLAQKDVFLLSNNEPAVLHSFVDVGFCEDADRYEFKGFAAFTGPDTRVWENQPMNYRLTLSQNGFDRTLDVIRP